MLANSFKSIIYYYTIYYHEVHYYEVESIDVFCDILQCKIIVIYSHYKGFAEETRQRMTSSVRVYYNNAQSVSTNENAK